MIPKKKCKSQVPNISHLNLSMDIVRALGYNYAAFMAYLELRFKVTEEVCEFFIYPSKNKTEPSLTEVLGINSKHGVNGAWHSFFSKIGVSYFSEAAFNKEADPFKGKLYACVRCTNHKGGNSTVFFKNPVSALWLPSGSVLWTPSVSTVGVLLGVSNGHFYTNYKEGKQENLNQEKPAVSFSEASDGEFEVNCKGKQNQNPPIESEQVCGTESEQVDKTEGVQNPKIAVNFTGEEIVAKSAEKQNMKMSSADFTLKMGLSKLGGSVQKTDFPLTNYLTTSGAFNSSGMYRLLRDIAIAHCTLEDGYIFPTKVIGWTDKHFTQFLDNAEGIGGVESLPAFLISLCSKWQEARADAKTHGAFGSNPDYPDIMHLAKHAALYLNWYRRATTNKTSATLLPVKENPLPVVMLAPKNTLQILPESVQGKGAEECNVAGYTYWGSTKYLPSGELNVTYEDLIAKATLSKNKIQVEKAMVKLKSLAVDFEVSKERIATLIAKGAD